MFTERKRFFLRISSGNTPVHNLKHCMWSQNRIIKSMWHVFCICHVCKCKYSSHLLFIEFNHSQSIKSTCEIKGEWQPLTVNVTLLVEAARFCYTSLVCAFGSTGVSRSHWQPCWAQGVSIKYAEGLAGIMSCLCDKRRFLCKVEHIEMAVALRPSHAVTDRC